MESKRDIRIRVLEKRSIMSEIEWEENSCKIFEKVVVHPFFLSAEVIYCYIDYKREVATRKIIEHAWSQNKKVAVPRIEDHEMNFYYLDSFSQLKVGYKGILEPTTTKKADDKNALVVMPGAVFDKNLNRIGYGKGFYDKYLIKHGNHKTIALAFELQMVKNIPTQVHDIKPNVIITEDKIYD